MNPFQRRQRIATYGTKPASGRTPIWQNKTTHTGQSRRYDLRRKRRLIMGAISGTIAVGSWLFAFHALSSSPSLQVTDVRVYGADAESANRLSAAAFGALNGTYFGIIPKANVLVYPEKSVAAAVSAASPSVRTVSVARDGMHALSVSVSEKVPAAIACAGLPNFDDSGALSYDVSQSDCYYADDTGFMFKKAPDDAPHTYNRFYVPYAAVPSIGAYATSTELFKRLQSFVNSVRAEGMKPYGLLVNESGDYELYIGNPDESVAIVYLNETADFDKELSNLAAFWNGMVRTKAVPPSFEYIDVRYGSNVFYRLIQ